MRSLREIRFRLGQEAHNLRLLAAGGGAVGAPTMAPLLPDPIEALRGSAFEREVLHLAGAIMEGQIPLFGKAASTGDPVRWRRDFRSGVEAPARYFRTIPYLDPERAGDHKLIWELNRHQHLVVLAQAWRFTGSGEILRELVRQIESWIDDNPFQRGVNWASALEVAFRALSWLWIWRLASASMHPEFLRMWARSLQEHGSHLERNLSVYFSPNTHLLGEAVALHALGVCFPSWPDANRWRGRGRRVVLEQMDRQVRADGSHFEQSSYYHVYALDFFLLHRILEPADDAYDARLGNMAAYLDALLGPAGRMPFLGDDDGGRVFHPYGDRAAFGRATLATCGVLLSRPEWIRSRGPLEEHAAWWLGPDALAAEPGVRARRTHYFRDAGLFAIESAPRRILVDAGPFGEGGAGHSHSDTLAVVVDGVLADPGTYTYVGDPAARAWFRSSAAHNTVRIAGRDQAVPVGPFRWKEKPEVRVHRWSAHEIEASCRYAGFEHRRRLAFFPPDTLAIADDILGPPGVHRWEQHWHCQGSPRELAPALFEIAGVRLALSETPRTAPSWISPGYDRREPAIELVVDGESELPVTLGALIYSGAPPREAVEWLLAAGLPDFTASIRTPRSEGAPAEPGQGRPRFTERLPRG